MPPQGFESSFDDIEMLFQVFEKHAGPPDLVKLERIIPHETVTFKDKGTELMQTWIREVREQMMMQMMMRRAGSNVFLSAGEKSTAQIVEESTIFLTFG